MAKKSSISEESVLKKIYLFRNQKVMLDRDLAQLYNVSTGNLNKAVKRNQSRFLTDFMFQLTTREYNDLVFQNGISSWGGVRTLPFVFTEQGVAMLSSVLNSYRAVAVNIRIMRIFTKLREVLLTHKDVLIRLEKLEQNVSRHDEEVKVIFNAIRELFNPSQKPRKKIGFKYTASKTSKKKF